MANDLACSVLTTERNRLPSVLTAPVPGTSNSTECMRDCYTEGIALSNGNHWPINVGGHGTDMK